MIYLIILIIPLAIAITIFGIQFLRNYGRCKKSYKKFRSVCDQFSETFDSLKLIIQSENNEYSQMTARTKKVWENATSLSELYSAAHLIEGALKTGLHKAEHSTNFDQDAYDELKQTIRSEKRKFLFRLHKLDSQAQEYYDSFFKFIPLPFLPEQHLLPPEDELWSKSTDIRDRLLGEITQR